MKAEADARNTPLFAVVFPLLDFPIDGGYPFKKLHEQILAMLSARGISALDLQSAFAGVDVRRLQLVPGRDSHPNEIGHRIAAEAIYRWLREQGGLPRDLFVAGELRERDNVRSFSRPGKSKEQ